VPALFQVLKAVFGKSDTEGFLTGYEQSKNKASIEDQLKILELAAQRFAEGAAKSAGGAAVAVVKSRLAGI
jgi:hypothetical protein